MSVGGSPVRAAICCECVVCASKDRRRLCGTAAALRGAVGPICRGKRRDLFGAKADATATRRRHRFWPWKLPRRCRTGVGTAQQRWLGLRLSRDAVRTEQKLDVAGVSEAHRTGDARQFFLNGNGRIFSVRPFVALCNTPLRQRKVPAAQNRGCPHPRRWMALLCLWGRTTCPSGSRSLLGGLLATPRFAAEQEPQQPGCPSRWEVPISAAPWSPRPQNRRKKQQRPRLC